MPPLLERKFLSSHGNSNLKSVLVDFGDTLAYLDETGNGEYHQAVWSVAKHFGYKRDLRELKRTLEKAIRNSMKGEFKGMQEFWEHFARELNLQKDSTLTEHLEKVRHKHSSIVFRLYEGVLPVLTALQRKYQLALVSNCAIGTSDVIKALGLASFFKCIILSYEVGVRKPHRQIYLETLRCLGLEPSECIFVADEISDLEGAREIGMKSLLVHQGSHTFQEAKDRNFQPDFRCGSISEIAELLLTANNI